MRQIIACVLCALALGACAEPTTQPGKLDDNSCPSYEPTCNFSR